MIRLRLAVAPLGGRKVDKLVGTWISFIYYAIAARSLPAAITRFPCFQLLL